MLSTGTSVVCMRYVPAACSPSTSRSENRLTNVTELYVTRSCTLISEPSFQGEHLRRFLPQRHGNPRHPDLFGTVRYAAPFAR